jgi:uncharacterized protein YfkK (UPF0435 family)
MMYWEKVKQIEEELEEVRRKIVEIEEKLKSLPEGHLEAKRIGNNVYYYLRYWEDGRLKSRYLGKSAEDVASKLREAEELKRTLSSLKIKKRKYEALLDKISKLINS